MIFTTDQAIAICLISPKILGCVSSFQHNSVLFCPFWCGHPMTGLFLAIITACLKLGNCILKRTGQTTMTNHRANNNENRKHILTKARVSCLSARELSVWPRHSSYHCVIGPCPVSGKYLQGFPRVCLRKMTPLQRPQQSLRSSSRISGTGAAAHMQEIA